MAVVSSARTPALRSSLRARVSPSDYRTIETMLERQFNTPLTSSVGRLFDAVASIVGVRDRVSYEGQAAMELEWLASNVAAGRDISIRFEVGDKAQTPRSSLIPGR